MAGPAVSGADPAFIEVSAKAGVLPYWSGITIHPYFRGGPETYGSAYDGTRALMKKYATPGQKIDVMCGESGYSTTWPGIDEETQGKYLARLFLFDVMSGVPLTIWYDWRDDGTDPKDQEHNFGIVHHDYHAGAENVFDPKPAYLAAQTYSRLLEGYRFKERVKMDSPNDYVLSFTKKGSPPWLVGWTTAPVAHEVKIPAPNGGYGVIRYDGKVQTPVGISYSTLKVTLDSGPQYIIQNKKL